MPAVPGTMSPLRTRGRPTLNDAETIGRSLLDAARELFLRAGYSATTMEAVASTARVSKSTLYARFADKPALFAAMVEDRLRVWSATSPMEQPISGAFDQRIERIAEMLLEFMVTSEIRLITQMVLAEAERVPEVVRIYRDVMFDRGLATIARHIEDAAAQDAMSGVDATDTALTLFELLSGWLQLRALRGLDLAADARDAAARVSARLLIRDLRASAEQAA